MEKRKTGFRAITSAYHSEVTGSQKLVTIIRHDAVQRVLVDCGFFQERKYQELNYESSIDPEKIDAIIITHNHIDHTGRLPEFVSKGFKGKIYATNITKELMPSFLNDSRKQQKRDAKKMQKKHPEDKKYKPLYSFQNIKETEEKVVGVEYNQTIEILQGIKVTFFRNAHLLGASMVLLQCYCEGYKTINIFDTGDYRLKSCFEEVPEIPEWLKNMQLIMLHESTNGEIRSTEIKKNFSANMIQAFKEKKDILIGAFAQGRMQELLYEFKMMQDAGLMPGYKIYVDGKLGIKTTQKYKKILEEYYPPKADFIPEHTIFVDHDTRERVFLDTKPKVVLTTSGMLSNGPAKLYVPFFIERENALIQLAGYAAEGTIARALYDGKKESTITINGKVLIKRADVRTTREKSGHAFNDEMINFLKQFNNIIFLGINHGSTEAQEKMYELIEKETNIDQIGFLNRQNMYIFYQNTPKGAEYYNMQIKRIPAKLDSLIKSPEEQERRKKKKAEKAAKKRRRNDKKKKRKAKKRKK